MNKLKSENNMINVIIVLLVLDVLTTLIAFNLGGTEQNGLLLYLSGLFSLSISMIVVLSHIIAIGILTLVKMHYNKIKEVGYDTITLTFIVMIIYILVIVNNTIQIGMRI